MDSPGPRRDSDPIVSRHAEASTPLPPLRQPPGLFLLFIVEMWERFSYYGMRALLVLYLISVTAVHQTPSGVYSNGLEITEVRRVEGRTDSDILGIQRRTLGLTIGESTGSEFTPPDGGIGTPLSVALTPMARVPDPENPKKSIWQVDAQAPNSPVLAVNGQSGKRDSFKPVAFAYEISNPTNEPVELRVAVKRDVKTGRGYFTVNDNPSEFTLKIPPDSQRKPDEAPSRLVVAPYLHDTGRGWTEARANTLYGFYTGLAYLLPLIGGLIADKLLGTHRSMVLGGVVIALGHVLLAVSGFGAMAQNSTGMAVFIAGLATIIIGTGYFKPTVSVMVGQLYGEHDPRRDSGFSIFYMGINLGAFICAFICGTLGEQVGWHWGFGSAAVGMVAGLLIYLAGRPKYLVGIGDPPAGKPNAVAPLLAASVVIAAVVGYAFHAGAFDWLDDQVGALQKNPTLAKGLVIGLVGLIVASIGWFVSIQKPGEKGPVAAIFIFVLFNALFWYGFEQAGSTMNVFAKNSTDRALFGIEFPATWFQSVNALLILAFAPVFSLLWLRLGRRNLNPTQPVKIALGLILLGLGFIAMVFGAKEAATGRLVSPMYLLIAYFLHTMGELCLSPTGLSFVTKTAPVRFVSLLMGVWFVSSFVANLGGGLVAAQVEKIEKGQIKMPWDIGGRADFFMLFVISSIGAGLLILALTPLLKRLLGSKVDA